MINNALRRKNANVTSCFIQYLGTLQSKYFKAAKLQNNKTTKLFTKNNANLRRKLANFKVFNLVNKSRWTTVATTNNRPNNKQ